ncbi:hypothetical protein C8Q79DRAFT_920072 [Trametes meyenii]|nr:hypothetical protein C8Q79DRAFT_920072 [Trametes meyenii]
MSTAQLSLDDFAFPAHRPHSSYELSYALGAPPSSALYPHASLDASPSSSHMSGHHPQLSAEAAYSSYLSEHPESYLPQYALHNMDYPFYGAHMPSYAVPQRAPSPRAIPTATPVWGATTSDNYGAPANPLSSSATFLHNLQNVIDSSHTTQVQQGANSVQAQAQPAATPSSSSWTLSGSLDPTTGVFQRSVENPRLRTAQACEKCRIRKAKCSGDHPACQRCVSRGLQCEYAPERKMRGPNKQKRKSGSHKRTEPVEERRSSVASVASTVSSGSEASSFDSHAVAAAAAVTAIKGARPSSRASSRPASGSSPLRAEATRPRSTTIALGAISRAAQHGSPLRGTGPSPVRQRPPPLNLNAARQFYPTHPNALAQYTRGGEPAAAYASASVTLPDNRRTSLPPYLLEAYSRVAMANAENAQEIVFHEPSPFVQPSSASSTDSSGMVPYVPFHSHHH